MKLISRLLAASLLIMPFAQAAELPKTLNEMAGVKPQPARLNDAVLVIIDAQREYLDGRLPLAGMDASVKEAARLLDRARKAGTPVVHVVHRGAGALFNPASPYFEIVQPLRPFPGEPVVEKTRVSAFAGTDLEGVLARTGRKKLILVGYMTHHCVSTTARAASDLGYAVTLVASATATRDLPDGEGGTLPAAVIQASSLAELADRTATVVSLGRDVAE